MADLAKRVHDNYLAARRSVGRATPNGTVRDEGAWLVLDGPARYRGARVALLDNVEGPATVPAVEWALEWAGTTGAVVLRDTDTWANRLISAAGLRPEGPSEVAMALPIEVALTAPASDAHAVTVDGADDLKHYARLVRDENGIPVRTAEAIARAMAREPGVRLHLLKVEDVVVARSMTCTWDGVCGLYNVYVPPAFRMRGFGRSISVASLASAHEEGARLACLQANEAGLPLYRSLGFQALYHYLTLSRG